MNKSILGIGTVSALGCGIESIGQALEGKSSPLIEIEQIETGEGAFSLPVYKAIEEGLERYMPRRSLRRMDRFLRMGLLASCMAMEDSRLHIDDPSRVGIIIGTGYGGIASAFGSFNSLV